MPEQSQTGMGNVIAIVGAAGDRLCRFTQRWIPDSWVVCMILTVTAILLAMFGADATLNESVLAWGNGMWALLELAMQFTIAMIAAHACVASRPVYRFLDWLADLPDKNRPVQAIALIGVYSLVTGYLNWALSVVASALFVPFIARRNPKADIRVIIAAGYLGICTIWHGGLSGSAPLILATPGNPLLAPASGEPVWYQLYATSNWDVTQAVVERVRTAGCPVIVLTVDLPGGSNRLTLARWSRTDDRTCNSCHRPRGRAPTVKPMFQGTSYRPGDFRTPGMTWDFIGRLREITDQKIVVKGLMTHEDATLALDHGVDGIWVSNHGGRAEGSGQATIDALPEIASVVAGRIPVIVDGGFRRGSDIFKGIARGADAVAVGRPYLWGLGAFGQAGVERVLEILSDELRITMRLAGTPSLASIAESSVGAG